MVIFHSYVGLPEGTYKTWWFEARAVLVYRRVDVMMEMISAHDA